MPTVQVGSNQPVRVFVAGDPAGVIYNRSTTAQGLWGTSSDQANRADASILDPNATLGIDGTSDIWVVAASGTILVDYMPTGTAFFRALTQAFGSLAIPSVFSPNYVAGTSGWTINEDGSVEFNNGIFRGFIVGGSLFIYTGTPGLGNPPIAWASSASTDPFGNTLTPAANVVLGAGQDGSPQVVLQLSGTAGEVSFPLPGSWTNFPNIFGSISGSGGLLSINGPTDTSVNDQAYIGLASALAGVLGASAGFVNYKDANGGHNTVAFWGTEGFVINAGSIAATEPGTGTGPTNPAVQETQHSLTLTTATASGNGVNGMRYKLMPFNCLLLEWDINTNSGNNVTIATLPAGWRPSKAHNIGSGTYGGATALTSAQNPHLIVNTNGTIVMSGTTAAAFSMCGTALIALD